jgi:[ribosomal protein S18]-alanine N-acetyltransferase
MDIPLDGRLSRTAIVRPAQPSDIDALLDLEAVFPTDRLDRRSFRHALRSPRIQVLVIEADGIAGYAMIHHRTGSALARLTSLAIHPGSTGSGLGRRLLASAEAAARQRGCVRLRLEVRADNTRAQRLYEAAGYRRFAIEDGYYDDDETAWRYEKALL